MGGRGKKFSTVSIPRTRKPRIRKSKKEQKLFFSAKAEKAIANSKKAGAKSVSLRALVGKRTASGKYKPSKSSQDIQTKKTVAASKIGFGQAKVNTKKLENSFKWRKNQNITDNKDFSPIRVSQLKNGNFVVNPKDAHKLAMIQATNAKNSKIPIVYTEKRATAKSRRATVAASKEGKVSKSTANRARAAQRKEVARVAGNANAKTTRAKTPKSGTRSGVPAKTANDRTLGPGKPKPRLSPAESKKNRGPRAKKAK